MEQQQTDKEKLIKTFKEIGVEFEINDDGDIQIYESHCDQMWFIFDHNDKYHHHEFGV